MRTSASAGPSGHRREGPRGGSAIPRDLLAIGLISIAAFLVVAQFHLFQRLVAWAQDAQAWAIAELPALGFIASLALGLFSLRRWQELRQATRALEQASAAQLQERTKAEALAELARQAALDPDTDRVVALACEQAAQLVQADYAAIALLESDDTVTWRGSWGTRSGLAGGGSRRIGRGPVGRAVREGRTIVAERLGDNPAFPADLRFNTAEGGRTLVATPLVTREGTIGALLLGWRREVAVAPGQLHLVETMAGYAAVILDHARAHAESERRRAEAEALAELVRQGATHDDPEQVMRLVCEQARRLVGADYAGVSLVEADGTRRWHGLSGNRVESWQEITRGRGTGATAQALAAGRTVILERLHERPDASRIHTREGGRTVLATPLLGAGLSGALHLGWRTEVTPSPDQVRLAEALASYASTILARARMHAALAARAAELAASEARLRALYEAVACGVLVRDASGAIVHANAAAEAVLGLSFEQMRGRGTEALWTAMREDGSLLPGEERAGRVALRTGQPVHGVIQCVVRPDGERRWLQVHAVPVLGEDGTPIQVVSSFIDITERKRAEAALEQQALHDSLTGLPNRLLLRDRVHQCLLAARREERPLALLLLDLDGFKQVNDTLGHQAGDAVLQRVARRLGTAVRATDTVARLGGDEFAVLLPGAAAEGAVHVARKLLRTFDEPFGLEGRELRLGASLGIALAPAHGQDYDTLLRHADIAMYTAKRGLKGYAVYTAEDEA